MIDGKDLEDTRLAREVALLDVWDLDDRISRLEDLTCRLESVLAALIKLYEGERIKDWELILRAMMEKQEMRTHYGSKGNHR